MTETTLDYTGQRRDDTGLLFYNARYYDPQLGRFISADTIVPGVGPLTLSPHDATAQGLWGKNGGGTTNPQELNRYAYINNNPINGTDPTGHCSSGLSWDMINGKCFNEALLQYMDSRNSFKDRAVGFTYAQLNMFLVALAAPFMTEVAIPAATASIGSAAATGSSVATIATSTATQVLSAANKADARVALRDGIEGLSTGQTSKALNIISKGRVDSISMSLLGNGNVSMVLDRAGANGFQRMIYMLDPSGKTIRLLQLAFNSSGELVHAHDKLTDTVIK